MLRNDPFECSLLEETSMNKFNVAVRSVNTPQQNGKYFVYVGSTKNPKYHCVEYQAGKRINDQPVSFSYTDPNRSSIVISLFNRKSFWAEDQKVGECEIPISDFPKQKSNYKEVQFSNGQKVLIQTDRIESW